MTRTRIVPLALAMSLCASPVLAQTGGGVLTALVKEGQTVDVIDELGSETHGKIRGLSLATLTLERAGTLTEIPVERITQIARPSDSLANGAVIGLAAGVAFGILGSTVGTSDCEGYDFAMALCPQGPRYIVASALIFGGIGAGIGVGIDALIHHKRVIYRRDSHQTRLAPVVGPGIGGAVISVSW